MFTIKGCIICIKATNNFSYSYLIFILFNPAVGQISYITPIYNTKESYLKVQQARTISLNVAHINLNTETD